MASNLLKPRGSKSNEEPKADYTACSEGVGYGNRAKIELDPSEDEKHVRDNDGSPFGPSENDGRVVSGHDASGQPASGSIKPFGSHYPGAALLATYSPTRMVELSSQAFCSELSSWETLWNRTQLSNTNPRAAITSLAISGSDPLQETQSISRQGSPSPALKCVHHAGCLDYQSWDHLRFEGALAEANHITHAQWHSACRSPKPGPDTTQCNPWALPQQIPKPYPEPRDFPNSTDDPQAKHAGHVAPTGDTMPTLHNLDDAFLGLIPRSARDNIVSVSDSLASARISIQELFGLVGIFNGEWLQQLRPKHQLLARCLRLSPSALVDRGFSALQQCFESSSKNSFENLFALVHVAFALAYMLHKNDDFYYWDGLFNHLLQWQHLLSIEDDKKCFQMTMDQLSGERRHELIDISKGSGLLDQMSYKRTPSMLRNGPAMQDCTTFLDNIEYTRLSEQCSGLMLAQETCEVKGATIQEMVDRIIKPLKHEPLFEAFHWIIDNTEFQLKRGLLCNPYEVEVMLIRTGGDLTIPRTMFDIYEAVVKSLCDMTLQSLGPNWRDSYHVALLNGVIATFMETEKHHTSRSIPLRKDLSVIAVVLPNRHVGCSSTSLELAKRNAIDHFSPSKLRSDSTSSSPEIDIQWDSSTSSMNTSPEAPTGLFSTTLQAPEARDFRCPTCSKTFKAKAGASNLIRHRKTHNNDRKFSCRVPGCGKMFSRSDNLKTHIKTHNRAHDKPPSKPLQPAMKRAQANEIRAETVESRPREFRQDGGVELQRQRFGIPEPYML